MIIFAIVSLITLAISCFALGIIVAILAVEIIRESTDLFEVFGGISILIFSLLLFILGASDIAFILILI